ncbi:hypothetical protein PPYR_01620 [Photinus pyralis]|uniref:Methionine--tRNA ligase, cytoplasmic n=1 Tax=Photinus pyralis TaxID=7054 RepID=A0A1Y1N8Z9_PHOPY|nr:methionine--tRNA ligase, cytoplasmic [Photinus pyralis]KAB0804650.1 hypothetical protein PPYR_01620 [Photinus pyralis]
MLVIQTNENNPSTLKILIAANFIRVKATLEIPSRETVLKCRRLPSLTINDNLIFIPNAAAYYLFPPTVNQSKTDEWLEWESTVLSPNIAITLGTSFKNPSSKKNLINNLKKLNDAISASQRFLGGDTISVCDIAIWSTLYPLYKDAGLVTEYLSELKNVSIWLKSLESMPEFKKALQDFKVTAGSSAYQVLFNSAKYFVSASATNDEMVSSPQHASDPVTADEILAAKKAWNEVKSALLPKKEVVPVLPVPGEKNILITSALPYVNNVPHLGNIIGCVLSGDVFARFSRLCNYNTLYICGTDEYGTATETKALEEGLTPQQICDKYFEIHNAIYRWFNIGFDHFGRTTTPEQTSITQKFFLDLNSNGFMQVESVEQLLCEKCDRYLADRFVEGGCPHPGCNYDDARGDQCDSCGKLITASELINPRCKVCGTRPVVKNSDQFFLDLPKIEPLLYHWMKNSSPGWSNNASVIAQSWVREGLKPRCITRDLKWGVPVPLDGYRDKVFYVWFDAPIGYVSITKRYTEHWEKWWKPSADTPVTLYQFMAKDNVPFHSVMFPACLLGLNQGYTLVQHIMATEYLNYEDGKFSKSRGVGVFGNNAQDTGIPSDVWRFYLLYIRPESQDSSFSWNDLVTKNNSELLNNLGNFINRAQVFAEKFFNGVVPDMNLNDEDYTLLALCTREVKEYVKAVEKCKLRDGIRHILTISRHGNQYMQVSEPWVQVKGTDEQKARTKTVIGLCCNLTCLLAVLLSPYMPNTSRTIRKQLNAPDTVCVLDPDNPEITNLLKAGHQLGKPSPLFDKIDQAKVDELKKQFGGKQETSPKKEVGDVSALEASVNQQADKVRALKSSGAAKTLWQPEVNILLDLKKQLEAAKTTVTEKVSTEVKVSAEDALALEQKVEEQATLVRNLKSSGAPKTEWQPQVNMLLELKQKLALATGKPIVQAKKSKK